MLYCVLRFVKDNLTWFIIVTRQPNLYFLDIFRSPSPLAVQEHLLLVLKSEIKTWNWSRCHISHTYFWKRFRHICIKHIVIKDYTSQFSSV